MITKTSFQPLMESNDGILLETDLELLLASTLIDRELAQKRVQTDLCYIQAKFPSDVYKDCVHLYNNVLTLIMGQDYIDNIGGK